MNKLNKKLVHYMNKNEVDERFDEIIRRNNLIAIYMGYKKKVIPINAKCLSEYPKYNQNYIMNYGFHYDIRLLMTVIKKIASFDCTNIDIHCGTGATDSFSQCVIETWLSEHKHFKTSEELNSDEQDLVVAIYDSVTEYVEWYLNINNK